MKPVFSKTVFAVFAVLVAVALSPSAHAQEEQESIGAPHQECVVNMDRVARNLPRISDKTTQSERSQEEAKNVRQYINNVIDQGGRCLKSATGRGASRAE